MVMDDINSLSTLEVQYMEYLSRCLSVCLAHVGLLPEMYALVHHDNNNIAAIFFRLSLFTILLVVPENASYDH